MRVHILALAIMIAIVIGLAPGYDIAHAEGLQGVKRTCQDLLDNNTYRCMVKDETGKEFEDCLRFVSPGNESEDFDMFSDKFGGAFGCECKPTGSFFHPNWGQSRAFYCVYGYSIDETYSVVSSEGFVTANGEHIIKGKAVNNEGLLFVFRCVQDPDCELPVVVETNCFDGIDNDDDELTDCEDPDCSAAIGGACDTGQLGICGPGTLQCVGGQQECIQNNQAITEGPYGTATCGDGLDNDCDGLVDADDSDCSPLAESNCFDGIDNNGDGFTDCADQTCDGIQGSTTECGVGQCYSMGFQICQGGLLVDTCEEGEPTAELCNGLDDDCNQVIDNGSPSDLCPLPAHTATTACNFGNCEIITCSNGYGDLDGLYGNGCECLPDPNEVNNDCADITDLGEELKSNASDDIEVTGRLSYIGDVDYYKVRAVDDYDSPGQDYFYTDQRIDIEFAQNPNDEFRFDVYRDVDGSCVNADLMQSATSSYFYYGYPHYCEYASNCVWSSGDECFECEFGPPPPAPIQWDQQDYFCDPIAAPSCSGNNSLDCVTCYRRDDTAYFYIKVYRKAGANPSCNQYILRIKNEEW